MEENLLNVSQTLMQEKKLQMILRNQIGLAMRQTIYEPQKWKPLKQSTICVLGNGGTAAHCAARANCDWCNQHTVATHMHIVFNDGAVFVGTVIVGRDATRAIVHALTHSGIAEVRQVIGFGAFGQGGIFHFDKIANVHFGASFCTRTQSCKLPNQGALPDCHT